MKLLEKIKMILTNPSGFFKKTDKKYSIKESFIYMATLSLFGIIMGAITSYFFQPAYSGILSSILGISLPSTEFTLMFLTMIIVSGYVMTLISSFFVAGILHIWILIFGGKSNYNKTYHLYNHARTPSMLFSWIPFVGSLMSFYTLAIMIVSTPITHKISKRRSAVIYLIPVLIFIIFIIIAAFVGLMLLRANPGLIQNITV